MAKGYEELRRQYRELDRDCALLSRFWLDGKHKKSKIFLPTEEHMRQAWSRVEELKKRMEELEEPDRVFSLIKHHFKDFLDSLEYTLKDKEEHPEADHLGIHWEIENTSRLNRHPDEERCQGLLDYLREICEAKDSVLELIQAKEKGRKGDLSDEFMRESRMVEMYRTDLKRFFSSFSQNQLERLKKALAETEVVLEEMAEKLRDGKKMIPAETEEEDLKQTVKMDEELYRTILQKQMGVSLDELLSWYQEEIEKTRADVFDIAGRLDIPEPAPTTMEEINEILFKYEGPCDTPEEMLARANEYLKRTRALAHEYVRLPEDEECICLPVPECCKDSYPWGGYEGGDFSIRPLVGQMFLNVYNYKNVTDGWIRMNTLHEAYPGHHVQYVKAVVDETPETVKIGAKLVPLLEGTCLRTERAFQDLFSEDPFFPLFVAYRRHHASVRICADLMLFYYGASLEEVIELYEKELGFDWVTARGQVRAHQNSPGYFTCYYYGMKKICEWEKVYGFSKKEYTELLFSAGYISMDRFEELVKMTTEERERYFHDFSSLLQEN